MTPVAKRRLAHIVDPLERAAIVRALFDHVVGVLCEAGLDVVALAPHPLSANGIEVWRDAASGLNAALDQAVDRIGTPVLIMHADLPALSSSDVDALLESPADVVIARALDGGTNALLLRKRMRTAFGRVSALTHAQRARRAGLRAHVIDRPGLALDVDDEAALIAWRGGASPQRQT
jgi:2-phospho-L-lactate guanylyltransferase